MSSASSPAPTIVGDSSSRKNSDASSVGGMPVPTKPASNVLGARAGELPTVPLDAFSPTATVTSLNHPDLEKATSASSPYDGAGMPESPYVVKWLEHDPESPFQWSNAKKWTATMVAGMSCLAVAFGSSVYAGGARQITEKFAVNGETFTAGLTLYVAGFALGPLNWAPISELYGRRIVFMASYGPFFLFNIGCALAQNIETLLVCRFLAGYFGSAPLTNSGGIISDCFLADQRALAMSVFALAPFAGPVLGPVVGGYVGQLVSWRWLFWTLSIFSGVMFVLGALVPETYSPVLLRRRARKLTKETGRVHVSVYDLNANADETLFSKLKTNCSRPFVLLFKEPIVLLFAIYAAVVYAELYLMFGAFPIIFTEQRGWNQGLAGLPFVGVGVGMLIGITINILYVNPKYVRDLKSKGGVLPPETRLPICCAGGVLLPIGLFWFAWTVQPSVHWIVPCLAIVPFGMGQVLLFLSMMNYMVDVYLIFAASALAANAVMRSILGAVLPLATSKMFHSMGTNWALTLLGFLALILAPIPFLFHKYGAKIRSRSSFAPGHKKPEPKNAALVEEVREADERQDEERASIAAELRSQHESQPAVEGKA